MFYLDVLFVCFLFFFYLLLYFLLFSMQTVIGKRSEMLVMSTEGPLGAYVNPSGHVHEIMTLYRANGLALIGVPDKEYSWFPGYEFNLYFHSEPLVLLIITYATYCVANFVFSKRFKFA